VTQGRRFLCLLLAFAWLCQAEAAVSVNAVVSNANVAFNAALQTSASQTNLTIASGSQTALLVLLNLGKGSAQPTGLTCTWGGTNVPLVNSAFHLDSDTQYYGNALFGLVAPTTGNQTISCGWTNGAAWYLTAIAFNGANQAGGTTTFANFNSAFADSVSPSGTASVAITSSSTDIAAAIMNAEGAASFSSVSGTQIFISTAGNQNAASNYATGSSPTVTLTGTLSSTAGWYIAGVDVVAASTCSGLALRGVGC
jgi:hypothetical protein